MCACVFQSDRDRDRERETRDAARMRENEKMCMRTGGRTFEYTGMLQVERESVCL